MEQKNQVIWTTRCKVMAKYISIYFDVFHQKLVGSGWLQATSETKRIREGYASDYLQPLHRIVWEMIQKNPDGFETGQKMGNEPEKSGQL